MTRLAGQSATRLPRRVGGGNAITVGFPGMRGKENDLINRFTAWITAISFITQNQLYLNFIQNADRGEPITIIQDIYNITALAGPFVILILASVSAGKEIYLNLFRSRFFPFLLYSAMSVSWARYPEITFTNILFLLAAYINYTVAISVLGVEKAAWMIIRILSFTMFVSLVSAIGFPAIGQHMASDFSGAALAGSWRGAFVHKNALGAYSAYTAVALIGFGRYFFDKKPFWIGAITVSLVCLLFSRSATSLVAFVVMAIFLLIIRLRLRLSFTLTILISMLGLAFILVAGNASVEILQLLGRDGSFSGRDLIWQFWLTYWNSDPIIGMGYAATKSQEMILVSKEYFTLAAVSPHSSYIEIYLNLGLIGTVLFGGAIFLCFIQRNVSNQLVDVSGEAVRTTVVVFLVGAMVTGFAEVTAVRAFGAVGNVIMFAIILLSASFPQNDSVTCPRISSYKCGNPERRSDENIY